MPFPKAVDHHKRGKPLVPNCYGIFYALTSVCYWYVLSFFGLTEGVALALATSVLFGSTMGLIDDMVNLRWRYKAVLPIFASLPYLALRPMGRTAINLPFIGVVNLGETFFLLFIPAIVTVTTNTYNQLGGLNGLESLPGLVILVGLSTGANSITLTIVPILCLLVLGYLSYTGKAFIGNVGSFSIGLTLAVYSILMNLKLFLLISLTPYIINSLIILFSTYILGERANTLMDEAGRLYSEKARSLRTLILSRKPMAEHQVVWLLTLITAVFTFLAFVITRNV
jgi:UDP-N-acetylglucosamine--dolichyl-phosphate N-acetylglucosaminephosphotransferase